MSRYTGPSWKVSRRLGYSTLETGKEIAKRHTAPGQHGDRRQKLTEYATQLQEKQKVRFTYGVSEKQFKKIFLNAKKMEGQNGVNFLILLETRLDNLVYRLGFAATRRQARQLVAHGHITVNGKKLNIPSFQVKPDMVIGVKEEAKGFAIIKSALESTVVRAGYLNYNENKMEGTLVRLPERNEFLPDIRENLIVEFYNR